MPDGLVDYTDANIEVNNIQAGIAGYQTPKSSELLFKKPLVRGTSLIGKHTPQIESESEDSDEEMAYYKRSGQGFCK